MQKLDNERGKMKYSEHALFLLAAKETKLIKSNAKFWKDYSNLEFVKKNIANNQEIKIVMAKLRNKLATDNSFDGFICPFDPEFPALNCKVTKNSEKPFLLFYRGELSLLKKINNNVSVIGCTDPSPEIVQREQKFVNKLINEDLVIVSGLAKGCDSIAHIVAVENQKPTIAILPSTFEKIYPKENRELALNIIRTGGLVISEYYNEPETRFEAINRFIERDRLQAMFSKAIILTSSYRKNEGDSGSRHAMEYAKLYGLKRYVMIAEADIFNSQFGLNYDILQADVTASKLTHKSIKEIKNFSILEDETKNVAQTSLLKF